MEKVGLCHEQFQCQFAMANQIKGMEFLSVPFVSVAWLKHDKRRIRV